MEEKNINRWAYRPLPYDRIPEDKPFMFVASHFAVTILELHHCEWYSLSSTHLPAELSQRKCSQHTITPLPCHPQVFLLQQYLRACMGLLLDDMFCSAAYLSEKEEPSCTMCHLSQVSLSRDITTGSHPPQSFDSHIPSTLRLSTLIRYHPVP